MGRKKHKAAMLQYVRDNNNWTEAQEERAWEIIDNFRCPIEQADESISWDIQQLLEDYCSDNDLPTDAWEKYFDDLDDVWCQL